MVSPSSPRPSSPVGQLSPGGPSSSSSPRPLSPGGLLAAATGRLPPSRSALSPPLIPLPESPSSSSGRRPFTPTFALPPSLWPTSTSPTPPTSSFGTSRFPPPSPAYDGGDSAPSTPGIEDGEGRPRLRRNISSAGSGADQDGQDTFRQQIAIKVKAPVGSMSISPAHRDVVLAARQGLYIIDLSLPTRVPRFLPQGGLHSVADVQWSPHSSKPHYIVSTSSEKMLLWNLGLPSERGIEREVVAHRRAVTDINWAVFNDTIVATGSLDGFIKMWDVRTSMDRDCERFSAWGFGSGATQVKWNRKKEHVIASSHDNKVLIWDTRMGSIPVTKITAHSAKIYGIDWSRENAHEIVTCSFDKTIKTWSIPSLNSSVESYEALPSSVASFLPESIHVQPPTPSVDPGLPVHWSPESLTGDSAAVNLTPSRVIQASAPVFRARNLPFGSGLLSLPQSEETHLDLWALGEPGGERVIKTFEGHTDKVKEFVWRIRGGEDLDRDDRSFQLITWGMDQSLRFWPIREGTLLDAGHKPQSAIKVIMTRKGAVDQTFIDEPDPQHASLASAFNLHSSFSGASAEASSSGFGSSGFFGPVQGPHISAPVQGMNILRTVRTGTHHHHHHRRPHHLRNALSPSLSSTGSSSGGLSNVAAKEPEKPKDESESTKKRRRSVSAGKERKPVMTRGTTSRGVAGKTDAMVAMEWNDNVEYIHSKVNLSSSGSAGGARSISLSKSRSGTRGRNSASGSRLRGELSDSANWDAEDEVVRLETEFKDVLPIYAKEIKVETFDIPGRKIIFSLNGPWGPPASTEAPVPTLTFIRIGLSFPPTYPKSSTRPTIDLLEMRTIVEPDCKQRVRDAVRSACEISSGNCLDLVFRILLGREIEEEDERGRSRGQKTVFWEEEKAEEVAEESSDSGSSDEDGENGVPSAVQTVLTKEHLRRPCGAVFGFGGHLVSFTTIRTTVNSNRGSFSNRSPSVSRDREREPRLRASPSNSNLARPAATRSMNDAMLLLYRSIKDPNGQKAAPKILQPQQSDADSSDSRAAGMLLLQDRSASRTQKPMSILQIRNVDALFVHPRLALAEAYLLKGLPLIVCRRNLAVAKRLGYHSHVRGWQLLELLLTPTPKPAATDPVRPLVQIREEERLRDRTSMAQLNALILEYLSAGDVQMLASMAVVLQLKKDVSSYPSAHLQSQPTTASVVRFSGGREILPPVEPRPRLSRLPSRTAEPTSRGHSPASNASPGPGRRSSYRDNTSSWSMFGSGFNLLGSNISIPHPPSLRDTFLGREGAGGSGAGDESYSSHPIDAHRASVDSGPPDSSDASTLDDRRRGRLRREEENSPPTLLRPQSDPTAPSGHSLRSKVLFGSGPSGNGAASYGAAPKMQSVAEVDLDAGGSRSKKSAKRPMVIKATFRVERPAPVSSIVAGGHCVHPMVLAVFHSAKAGYADFLWRWSLFQKRAELGKAYHLSMQEEQKPPLQVVTSFDIGRRETKRQEETGFPIRMVAHALCDLCRKPVHGLSFPCLKCHHLTHPSCLSGTRTRPDESTAALECPTGCGCVCGRAWEMEGGFAATPSAIRERLGLSGKLTIPLPGTRSRG